MTPEVQQAHAELSKRLGELVQRAQEIAERLCARAEQLEKKELKLRVVK